MDTTQGLVSVPDPLSRLLRTLAAPSAEDVTDADLLARGDAASLELVIRRHAGMVWRVCLTVTREPHAAEDAFQATFLALARRRGAVRDRTAAGWLHRVAYRLARRARPAFLPAEYPEPEAREFGPDERVEQAETALAVLDAVSQLPDRYRVPVVLCHLEGFTQAEAAAQLGLPLGTVAVRVKRGLERLRVLLARTGTVAAPVLLTAFSGIAFAAPPRVVFRATEVASGTAVPSPAVLGLFRRAFAAGVSLKVAGLVTVLALTAGGIVWGQLSEPRPQPLPVVAELPRETRAESAGFRAFAVTTDLQRAILGDPSIGTCVCLGTTVEADNLRVALRAETFPKGQGVAFVRRPGAPLPASALHALARECGFDSAKVLELELLPPERWTEAPPLQETDESATFLGTGAAYPVGTPLCRILTGGADAVLGLAGPRGGDDWPNVATLRRLLNALELPARDKLAVLSSRHGHRLGDDHDRKGKPAGRNWEALAADLGFGSVAVLPVARPEPHDHDREHGGRPPRK